MNIAVIFAGGVGKRINSKELPKQFLEIYSKPIIVYTIEHFENNKNVDGIVVVCNEEWIDYFNNLVYKYRLEKVKKVVPGGKTGQLSIYNGLCAAKELTKNKKSIVLIHDGVRPLITDEIITDNIKTVKKYKSSITCGVVKETIVQIDNNDEVIVVPNRDNARVAKAPQSFYLDDILKYHKKALEDNNTSFVDCCTMLNHYGVKTHMLEGPNENIKITTPDDLYLMRALLQAREDSQLNNIF